MGERKKGKFSKSAEQFHDGKFFEDQFRIFVLHIHLASYCHGYIS